MLVLDCCNYQMHSCMLVMRGFCSCHSRGCVHAGASDKALLGILAIVTSVVLPGWCPIMEFVCVQFYNLQCSGLGQAQEPLVCMAALKRESSGFSSLSWLRQEYLVQLLNL